MALIKEVILRLKAEGFNEAAAGAQKIAGALDVAEKVAGRTSAATTRMATKVTQSASAFGQLSSIASRLGSASGSPLLSGAAGVIGAAGAGFAYGGAVGSAIAGGSELVALLIGALSEKKAEVTNNISVPLQDGDVRRALSEANEALRIALERRLGDLDDAARNRADAGALTR